MAPVAMISGHLDLTPEEFAEHYQDRIFDALKAGHDIVVGDARGADTMAQCFIVDHYGFCEGELTVYHMFDSPRNFVSWVYNVKGGFQSDEERDAAMTAASDYDIAWVRAGREKSGTAKNIERRKHDR